MRSLFRNAHMLPYIHTSPWSNLPACLLGLSMAHYYFELTNKKIKIEDEDQHSNRDGEIKDGIGKNAVDKSDGLNMNNTIAEEKKGHANSVRKTYGEKIARYLFRNMHFIGLPGLATWVFLGARIEDIDSRAVTALYVGMERMVFSLLFGVGLTQMFILDGPFRRFLAWRGWQAAGRLAFSLMMLHWSVNVTIVAGRPHAVATSAFYVSLDWVATLFYTYLLALPVCLLVELPMQKFLDVLITVF